MTYTIQVKKLAALINPLTDGDNPISKEDIEKALKNADIFVQHDNTPQDKIRRIAYEVANPSTEPLVIDIGFPQEGEEPKILHNMEKLAAALYKHTPSIDVLPLGSIEAIKSLLGIKGTIEPSINYIPAKTEQIINWDEIEIKRENPWENHDYILENIRNHQVKELTDIMHLIPEAIWEDNKFLLKALETNSLLGEMFSRDIQQDPEFIKVLVQAPEAFMHIWLTYYNKDFTKSYGYTPEYKLPEKTKTTIVELLNDKTILMNILKNRDGYNVIDYLSKDIRSDIDVVLKLLQRYNDKEHSTYGLHLKTAIADKFFDDDENSLAYLNQCAQDNRFRDDNKRAWINWIQDKNKVLSYLERLPPLMNYDVLRLAQDLPASLKQDDEVITAFMQINGDFYKLLSPKNKANSKYINLYVQEGTSLDELPRDLAYKVTDSDMIQKMLSKNPSLINEKNCPEEWKTNSEYLKACVMNNANVVLPASSLKVLNNYDVALEILKFKPEFYSRLSMDLKSNTELASLYFKTLKDYGHNDIPKELYASKDMCIALLKTKKERNYDFIPQGFWSDKSFLSEVLQSLDKKEIQPHHVFKIAPPKIKQIIDANNVAVGEYFDIMKLYLLEHKLATELPKNEEMVKVKKSKI